MTFKEFETSELEAFKCNLQDLDIDDIVMASVLFQVRDALTERYTERLTI